MGFYYPKKFKEYIENLDQNKSNIVHILNDSFQIITPNKINILDDNAFTKYGLVDNLDAYVSKELKIDHFKSLPFARILSGDKYGFLFFIEDKDQKDEMIIFHRDTDRLIYETVPIGKFSNYFGVGTKENDKVNLTKEDNILDFFGEYPEVNILEYLSVKVVKEEVTDINDTLTTKVIFNVKEKGTEINIIHTLISSNRLIKYKTKYFDKNLDRKYSYKNKLSYNYFSLMHYYILESLMNLKKDNIIKSSDLDTILKNQSMSQLVKKSMK